jgi:hypothetical protein
MDVYVCIYEHLQFTLLIRNMKYKVLKALTLDETNVWAYSIHIIIYSFVQLNHTKAEGNINVINDPKS